MIGIIYVLRNNYMHDKNGNPLYKIGLTEVDVESRIKSLSRDTGVPYPFDVVDSFEIENDKIKSIEEIEKWVHDCFQEYRVPSLSKKPKEFFILPDVNRVRHVLKYFIKAEVDINEEDLVEDEDKQGFEEKNRKERKENFRFSLANIDDGKIITFVKDENIRAKVVNDKQAVLIDENDKPIGEPKFLNPLTEEIFTNPIYNNKRHGSGSKYWLYNGKVLISLRSDYDND